MKNYIQQLRLSELAVAKDEGERGEQAILRSRVLPGGQQRGKHAGDGQKGLSGGERRVSQGDTLDLALLNSMQMPQANRCDNVLYVHHTDCQPLSTGITPFYFSFLKPNLNHE